MIASTDWVLLTMAAAAAITDARTGRIPNWLTLPVVALAPVVHGVTGGIEGFVLSLVGMILCGLPPLVVYRRGGMGGGDVKLFAALGATAGATRGLEVQTLAYCIAALVVIVACARRRELGPLLRTTFRRRHGAGSPPSIRTLRLGVPILAAASLITAWDVPWT
jgi:prepilin peptidase CpaA